VQKALAFGFKPNTAVYESPSNFTTPILLALHGVRLSLYRSIAKQHGALEAVSLLVRAGADIYHIMLISGESFWFEGEFQGKPVTPTAAAIAWDIKNAWAEALRSCGYVPEKVFVEDARRRKEFLRTHGATCSGVEISSNNFEENNEVRLRARRVFEVED
jgi:hypothetical protein